MSSTLLGVMLSAAAFAASSFTGFVTDANGVEPIADAVVSVEWRLVPDGKAANGRPTPTYLAVWQARTDQNGRFRLPESVESLVLPTGTALAPGNAPQLRVFALGHEAIQPLRRDFSFSVSSDRRVAILSWPRPDQLIQLERLGEADMVRQIDGWYAEVQRVTSYEVWPGGEAQAIASYRPLLQLISDACTMLEYRASVHPTGCTRARAEFGLRAPEPQWVEVRPKTKEQKSKPPPAKPIVVGTPAPESGTISGMKQEPPDR
jgi:hypothetical protein